MPTKFTILLLALALGNYCFSQNFNTDSLIAELQKAKEDTNKVNIYRNLGVSVAHKDPHEAIAYWKQGVSLGKKLKYDIGLSRCYVNIAAGYSFAAQYDSSLIYIDTAILFAHKVGNVDRLALVYLNRADALIRIQNFTEALKDCNVAIKYAEQAKNKDRLARIYHNISDIYSYQDQFKPAVNYLNKAVQLYREQNNLQMTGLASADMAGMYVKMGNTQNAIEGYRSAIRIADSVKDYKNLSAYHADLSDVYLSLDRLDEAEQLLPKAMHYAKEPENLLQQAIVYSHFCKLYTKQNRLQPAIDAGNSAYKLAKQEEDLLWQKITSGLLATAYRKSGSNEKAFEFLEISNSLNDSLLKQQYNEETANLQTRFEVEQKDKEILLLSKDKELQRQQLTQQRVYLFTSIAIALLALLGIALLINRYRLRQRMKELELRNEIAADLHDEVGSSLSSIHMLSQIATRQSGTDPVQKDILDRMSSNAKETMDKMGEIVWMIKPGDAEASSLKQRMERFAYEICSGMGIETSVDIGELDKVKLTMEERKNLYLVFKEALNNAVKYSNSKKIDIEVNARNKQLLLFVRDYGKGFDASAKGEGNGLGNMNNRARELGAHLDVQSQQGEGTIVKLTMPL